MRPPILFPLFADIQTLSGVGPKTRQLLKNLVGEKIVHLLYHLPTSLIDRRAMPALNRAPDGSVITAVVQVDGYIPPHRAHDKSLPFKVRCYNETGFLNLIYFNAYPDFLKKQLPIGQKRVVSGKLERFAGEAQLVHPDYVEPVEALESIRRVEPVYPLTAGLARKNLAKMVAASVKNAPQLPEWISEFMVKQQGWQSWKECITQAHIPKEPAEIEPAHPIRRRLAYDELLANQVALMLVRRYVNKTEGQRVEGPGQLRQALLARLPFSLTEGQKDVIREINADQADPSRMMRLLQGDVGAGKTVVALMAALNAVEAGYQVALMAPTEILSLQHYKWISQMLEGMDCRVELLIGKTKGKERTRVLDGLAEGGAHIVIGTHALFQEKVQFNRLGLVVIDEQHRFGVAQRTALAKKGDNVDVLLMSATPIPRTLTMTLYGDMECSRLTDKPAGRKAIDTRIIPASKIGQVVEGLLRVMDKGEKIYWICPLIEESETSDLAAAEERCKALNKLFPGSVGLMHGRMKTEEREQVMLNFRDGKIDILVATTVVEVGVDVPDATVIVIEHAERFGLSQLHQLRGRVGRNDKQSSCILLYHGLGEVAKERLTIMRESNDGFRLAEEDLRLRGGGDVLGTKQSGLPEFKVANLYYHFDLLKAANQDARSIMEQDPQLQTPRGEALRTLLYLFEYEGQVKFVEQ